MATEQIEEYKNQGITGLANLGNTCFMNSTLQCLSHTYSVNEFLKTGSYRKNVNKKAESLILLEWDKLRNMMWSENCVISPGGFMSSVQKVAKIKDRLLFTGFAQNDLTEFLIFLINCFHASISREVEMKITGDTKTKTDKLAKSCFEMMKNMYCKDYSEFLDLFYGIHVSKLETVSGEYITSKPEPFLLLDLPLPEQSQTHEIGCSLTDCLDLYTKEELLDGNNKYTIEKTGESVEAKKQILFWSLPEVLIITIKRFSNSIQKNNTTVDFPLADLDLSKYVIGYNSENYKYDLYGICNHMGDALGGHYTACVKNANNTWYHFNDQDVTPIEKPDALVSSYAYCLFYCKKNK
tara:strand:- start:3284 stop:4339 length:1056 start_codon:yes stop_codon:yes gene_type:complete